MKKILTIQDISCLGKCSLTVALPLISAMGVETVILPTALLSTHTMFSGFTCKDLADQIEPIAAHWKKEGVRFDAIYTGYLGTEEEIETVKKLIADFRTENGGQRKAVSGFRRSLCKTQCFPVRDRGCDRSEYHRSLLYDRR